MKLPISLRQFGLAAMILSMAGSNMALTLGRARGVPLVGLPLDIGVLVRLDAADDPDTQCFDAQVFYSDARVDPTKVRIAIERNGTSLDAMVRVRSTAAVDEPVVTLYLQSGCAQKVTRRYVILAELPVDTLSSGAPLILPPVVPQGGATAKGASSGSTFPDAAAAGAAGPATAGGSAVAAAKPPRKKRSPSVAAGAAVVPVQKVPPAAADANPVPPVAVARPKADKALTAAQARRERAGERAKSRLKLEPLDLLAERDPTLRSSSELLTQPSDDKVRAEAAAMWRAINAQPQDVLRDADRAKAMEGDIRALRETVAKNETSIVELRSQLKSAEDERYSNKLVYGLIALMLLLAAALAWLLLRFRQAGHSRNDWWQGFDLAGDEAELLGEAPEPRRSPKRRAPAKPEKDVDVDLTVDESLFEDLKAKRPPPLAKRDKPELKTSSLPPMDRVDFSASIPGVPRSVNAEELFDIHQQADFFLSLGQHDQAIEVLKSHIGSNVDTSALAYLDLFKIYHELQRKDEYSKLAQEFGRAFNAQVPAFESFSERGDGLEAYQTALSRIEALWPSPKVLDVIEESIFRKPGAQGETFDLEAYRELLMLYSVAKEIVDKKPDLMDFSASSLSSDNDDRSSFKTRFASTDIQPLTADIKPAPARARVPAPPEEQAFPDLLVTPRPSPRLGLDIDLSAVADSAPSAFMAPPPSDAGASDFTLDAPELELEKHEPSPEELKAAENDMDNLLDFDLFDSKTESEISRKPRKN